MLADVRTVIVDEIHAVAGTRRGAHLALSLERLESLAGVPLQRIGLSATQKPVENVGRLLVGAERECAIVDTGHRREMDLAVEIPGSPLETVCSHETWEEIFTRMAALIQEHRSTLLFVNTRKMAERVAARLAGLLGADAVTSHHGSLSRERRLEAERRLKAGELRALVATASLELGIDIGDVDLVIQAGVTPSIAVLIQRVGRAGHGPQRTPKGRVFPLTQDDLACAAALMLAVRRGDLDRTPEAPGSLDILAQQVVAECVAGAWDETALFESFRRAWPYRELQRSDFDDAVGLHTGGRAALLHRDGVGGRLMATRRARLVALTSGGAIPDTADYRVVLQPEETLVGTLNEDFAIEANVGDIFQLGNLSWRILKVETGVVRVADAGGAPPTIPFWLGEGPARTAELSEALSVVRERGVESERSARGTEQDSVERASQGRDGVPSEGGTPRSRNVSELGEGVAKPSSDHVVGQGTAWLRDECGLGEGAAAQLAAYLSEGSRALGAVPTRRRIIAERFFDESGGMQLILHSPLGGRINRAWGLALRKRFCRSFGFELQAAANEEAILLSLGPQHSFPLREVFDYLKPETARDVLVQAVLPSPLFTTRWRWNVVRSLVLSKTRGGAQRVPAALLRMRAEDLLVGAFPEMLACGETLPPGDLPVPWEHPLVRQTLEDCLHEAMDVEGFVEVLRKLREGCIEIVAVDTPAPSAFARGILNAMPWAFLDDAPLEERRARAVASRRGLDARLADGVGALDPEAVARVKEETWPQPENEEEVHEALGWMGYVTEEEARRSGWTAWIEILMAAGRVRVETVPLLVVEKTDLESIHSAERLAVGRASAAGPAQAGADQSAPAYAALVEGRPFAGDRREGGLRYLAVETASGAAAILRGRLEALGPVVVGEEIEQGLPAERVGEMGALEGQGVVLRCRIGGREAWCERRLLARIQSYTMDRLRKEISPVSAADLWRFLAVWQHADQEKRLEGPEGVAEVARQLAGFEIPAAAWEGSVLPARVRGYKPEWLDRILLTGEWVWMRLWGEGATVPRTTPLTLLPAADLDAWLELRGTRASAASSTASPAASTAEESKTPSAVAGPMPAFTAEEGSTLLAIPAVRSDSNAAALPVANPAPSPTVGPAPLSAHGASLLEVLERRGALFTRDLAREAGPLSDHLEMGLAELIARGRITCDSFSGMRRLIKPRRGRDADARRPRGARPADVRPAGRWSIIPEVAGTAPAPTTQAAGRRSMSGATGLEKASAAAGRLPEAMNRSGLSQAPSRLPQMVNRSAAAGAPGRTVGAPVEPPERLVDLVARQLLRRYGVVFRRLLERERIPVPWRYLVRSLRRMELRGEIRGGRFVGGFSGEQFALPEAIPLLREVRRREAAAPVHVSAADPLNLRGILTPEERVASLARRRVAVAPR